MCCFNTCQSGLRASKHVKGGIKLSGKAMQTSRRMSYAIHGLSVTHGDLDPEWKQNRSLQIYLGPLWKCWQMSTLLRRNCHTRGRVKTGNNIDLGRPLLRFRTHAEFRCQKQGWTVANMANPWMPNVFYSRPALDPEFLGKHHLLNRHSNISCYPTKLRLDFQRTKNS